MSRLPLMFAVGSGQVLQVIALPAVYGGMAYSSSLISLKMSMKDSWNCQHVKRWTCLDTWMDILQCCSLSGMTRLYQFHVRTPEMFELRGADLITISILLMIYVHTFTYIYVLLKYNWNRIESSYSCCFALQSYIPHLRSEVTWTLRALCSYPSLNKRALPYPGEHDGHDTDVCEWKRIAG